MDVITAFLDIFRFFSVLFYIENSANLLKVPTSYDKFFEFFILHYGLLSLENRRKRIKRLRKYTEKIDFKFDFKDRNFMNILFFMKPKNETAYIYTHNTIRQALEKMKHYNYSMLPVIEKSGKYAGTLSREDLLTAAFVSYLDGRESVNFCRIKDAASFNQKGSVNIYTEMEDLLQTDFSQDFIPVVDDRGLFIGIITRAEVLKYGYIKKSQSTATIIQLPQRTL